MASSSSNVFSIKISKGMLNTEVRALIKDIVGKNQQQGIQTRVKVIENESEWDEAIPLSKGNALITEGAALKNEQEDKTKDKEEDETKDKEEDETKDKEEDETKDKEEDETKDNEED